MRDWEKDEKIVKKFVQICKETRAIVTFGDKESLQSIVGRIIPPNRAKDLCESL